MSHKIQAIRGMNDILPDSSYYWQDIEKHFSTCLNQYSYQEVRFPIVESTQLFKRTIGEVTDIVEKEMYTFTDLNGDSLTLRPEGTAGCVRACIEHGLLHNQQQKLWYSGPMFRHEKPQKGRYRQFYQFGVEAIGIAGVGIELELIAITQRLWEQLGVLNEVHLEINSLGSLEERQAYREKLVTYFKEHIDDLDEDSKRRLERNPLRILDSKNPAMQEVIQKAPKLIDSFGDESRQHFDSFCSGLNQMGITYHINPTLVRGLDYYGHTVFEWVTDKLGSQATVCAGGRYDKLIEHLGGKSTPAVGFAIGIERLLLLRETIVGHHLSQPHPDIYCIAVGDEAMVRALSIAELIRNKSPNASVSVNTAGGSFKSQFKKADKSGARYALILGDDELKQNTIGIKDLRQEGEQISIPQEEMGQFIETNLM